MFANAGDHANAMCELYRATRPSLAQLETAGAAAVTNRSRSFAIVRSASIVLMSSECLRRFSAPRQLLLTSGSSRCHAERKGRLPVRSDSYASSASNACFTPRT